MDDSASGGLRESKKRQLREQIRACALALFVTQGYRDTTMEQIAAAAMVAPRTVYRYFPTKDTLVVTDEDDERMLDEFRAALATHSPIEAIRRAFRGVLMTTATSTEADRHRNALIAAEPELQAANLRFVIGSARRYAEAIVEHTGRPEDLDAALGLAGAAAGVALVMLVNATDGSTTEQLKEVDAALDRLEYRFDFSAGEALSPADLSSGDSAG